MKTHIELRHSLVPCYLLGLCLILSAVAAIAHDEHEALPSKGASVYKNMVLLTPQAEKAIGLKKTKIELDDWRDEIVVNATVDVPCTRHAYAASMVAGKIEELLVGPGDDVRQGQVLARVKSLELESLESQLLAVSLERDQAARVLEKRETLFASQFLPEKDVLAARTNFHEKTAELALLSAKLRAVGLSAEALSDVLRTKQPIRSLPIVSPIDGAVSVADVRVGESVEPIDHVFHLVDRSALAIVGEVLESDLWRVHEGMPVRIVLASFPDSPLMGTVEHVGLKLMEQERTMHVRVEMANPDRRIRPGLFGRMHIEVAHKPETVVCPADALIRHGDGCYVLREQGRNRGKYLLTRVSVGDRDDGRVEILDGLYPGQRVITTGTVELTALLNDAVAIADAKAAASVASQTSVVTPASWKPAAAGIRRVLVPGKIESATGRKQVAASTVTGRLASILVERGARVRRGDVLAEIDSLHLRNLQLDMLSAMVRLQFAEKSLKRLEKLKDDHQVDINRIWDLESSKRLMENKLATIASQLELMGLEPDEIDRLNVIDPAKDDIYDQITTLLPVRAPADGWVVDFELGLGEVVNPQQRLFELQDLSAMWVHGYVRENDAGNVRAGQSVTVTVSGDPSFVAQGTIARTSPEVSPTDRVLDVWAELDNSQLRLREGMLAKVAIDVDEAKEVRSQEIHENAQALKLPLPLGEGRGEGRRAATIPEQ